MNRNWFDYLGRELAKKEVVDFKIKGIINNYTKLCVVLILYKLLPPTGLEPVLQPPEGCALSTELRGRGLLVS